MSSFLFPDVNVWLALAHGRHPHNSAAALWFESLNHDCTVGFCRITQLGLLRTLTTQGVMGSDVMTQSEAWKTYDMFFRDSRVGFFAEPLRIEVSFRRWTTRREVSPKQWADGYLAAFAESTGGILVTFDRALAGKVVKSTLLTPS